MLLIRSKFAWAALIVLSLIVGATITSTAHADLDDLLLDGDDDSLLLDTGDVSGVLGDAIPEIGDVLPEVSEDSLPLAPADENSLGLPLPLPEAIPTPAADLQPEALNVPELPSLSTPLPPVPRQAPADIQPPIEAPRAPMVPEPYPGSVPENTQPLAPPMEREPVSPSAQLMAPTTSVDPAAPAPQADMEQRDSAAMQQPGMAAAAMPAQAVQGHGVHSHSQFSHAALMTGHAPGLSTGGCGHPDCGCAYGQVCRVVGQPPRFNSPIGTMGMATLPPPDSIRSRYNAQPCQRDLWAGYVEERRRACLRHHAHIHGGCKCQEKSAAHAAQRMGAPALLPARNCSPACVASPCPSGQCGAPAMETDPGCGCQIPGCDGSSCQGVKQMFQTMEAPIGVPTPAQ